MITDWTPPRSMPDAEERRRILIAEVQEIQAQLGNKKRKRETAPEEYGDWRYKAIWAMTNRLEDLRLVKKWIKDNYQE